VQVVLLFGEHGHYLPLDRPWDALIGPTIFPVVQIYLWSRLSNFLHFQCRHLRMVDPTLNFSIWSSTLHGSAVTA
jgi:hypothetical protein